MRNPSDDDDPTDDDPTLTEPDQPPPADAHLCPRCEGAGEVATTQNMYGVWETEACRWCAGTGEVTT